MAELELSKHNALQLEEQLRDSVEQIAAFTQQIKDKEADMQLIVKCE